jgi:YD repeat-containing protein
MLQQSRPYFVGGAALWTTFTYDALGRVVKETFPDGSATQHAYHGLTTSDTDALNQTRTVNKDSQGHVVSVTDAASKTTTYAYDPFGNLIQTTDPLGNVVTATYDVRGRKIAPNDPISAPGPTHTTRQASSSARPTPRARQRPSATTSSAA